MIFLNEMKKLLLRIWRDYQIARNRKMCTWAYCKNGSWYSKCGI